MSNPKAQKPQQQRFAIYTRYSSELQSELSLDIQERVCREAVAKRGGVVVAVYSDGARSGWNLHREGFLQLRRGAEQGAFDAVMFWKFDRLARDPHHAIAIKVLLRQEYQLKLYCVEGFSEDEQESSYLEQVLALFSAFYSQNLSTETKRGKRQRAMNGEFNGSTAPLGYTLITRAKATQEKPAGLFIDPDQADIVRTAFRRYASGQYSDSDIAAWMNQQPLIQELRAGKKPIGKEMVRDLLQNRVYTGRVPYAETLYSGTLGEGKRSSRGRKQWFEGKHKGLITDELFDRCQEVRSQLTKIRRSPQVVHTYILQDRVFCSHCLERRPEALEDVNFGKMRPAWSRRDQQGYYRCLARDRGYGDCEQSYIPVPLVDEQVLLALKHLSLPGEFQARVEAAVQRRVEDDQAWQRIAEIEETVRRIDFSWEQGFVSPEDYVAKRQQLQREIAALQPAGDDDLIEAADLLEHFETYWDACEAQAQPQEARRQLLAKIIDRVYVRDDRVEAMVLHGGMRLAIHGDTRDEEVTT